MISQQHNTNEMPSYTVAIIAGAKAKWVRAWKGVDWIGWVGLVRPVLSQSAVTSDTHCTAYHVNVHWSAGGCCIGLVGRSLSS